MEEKEISKILIFAYEDDVDSPMLEFIDLFSALQKIQDWGWNTKIEYNQDYHSCHIWKEDIHIVNTNKTSPFKVIYSSVLEFIENYDKGRINSNN